MEQLLSTFASGGIWLHWLPGFGPVGAPPGALSVSAVFSGAGAVILGKFTADLGALTLPLNYVGLFIGALLANWGLAGVRLPLAGDLETPIMFALTGMTFAGLAMMLLMRKS